MHTLQGSDALREVTLIFFQMALVDNIEKS